MNEPAPAADPGAGGDGSPAPSGGGGGSPSPAPAPATVLAPAGDPAPAPGPAGDPAPVSNQFANLGDNWRTDLLSQAGFEGDDLTTRQGQLERVLDMGTFAKNYFSAQDKIRTGQLSTGLPTDATPEQLTEWRSANDVPLEATGYAPSLPEGLVLGVKDIAMLAPIYAAGHAQNVSNAAMSEMVGSFLQGRADEEQENLQTDGIHKQQTTTLLKETWGQDFDVNVNMIKGLVARLPEAVQEAFNNSRMGDGRALFNSPEFMVFFADVARQLNPAGTVVPNANNPVQAIDDEIKALEARMGDKEWFKDTEAQNRYQALLNAKDGMTQQQPQG